MSNFGRHIMAIAIILNLSISLAQSDSLIYRTDLNEFMDPPSYSAEDGKEYNSPEFFNHPDFGKLTFKAPINRNVVEVLEKRTIDERFYIDLDDPTFFYIEKAAMPINMFVDGKWRAIDPSLHAKSGGVFSSGIQPVQTMINTVDGFTQFSYQNKTITNNQFELKIVHLDNSEETLQANWSQVYMTNFSAYVTDIFPQIDLRLKFGQSEIKSEFIIKQNLNVKTLIFIDHLELEGNLEASIKEHEQLYVDMLEIKDSETHEVEMIAKPARTFDLLQAKDAWYSDMEIHGEDLYIICDSAHLNSNAYTYPITVDPTFVAVGPVASGFGLIGSLLSPSFCSSNLVVNFPGGSTPWDTQIYFDVYTDYCVGNGFSCWMSEAQVWINSSCGGASPVGSPGIIWTCLGCSTPGDWTPTVPFNSSGTQSLVQCYSPSCSNQNLTFTINLNRSWCNSWGAYDVCNWGTAWCQALDQWSVTVQGKSVETLGNTVTGNGSANIYDSDCAGTQTLDPTPLYGVGPYTYNWSTGGSGATEIVPGTVGTYTCNVTDACGTTVTATFDIGCPLFENLISFDGKKIDDFVLLEWSIKDEIDITEYILEKSNDGEEWREIGKVEAKNKGAKSEYNFTDVTPNIGVNYYRIIQVKENLEPEYSEVISVNFKNDLEIYPNPANDKVNFIITEGTVANSYIIIEDAKGNRIETIVVESKQTELELNNYAQGIYLVKLYKNDILLEVQRLIKD
ncbi:T9SS type A sorting domain-containing protein [Paracrocinitomix mangrovi]|uniref:T9SS type A sorting domain-containing protein n=1 Tax=Paracrocinitomix mangrovi TaxID=2862509 RepID=UPI001C8F1519|nr:T9SS type A sorting domain-containing protein [Paracrocinitomix mangrovi]UKN01845.1 T9SS type A sorting domain-containing protein [Paracrocinitomix mangrovi]